MKSLTVVLCALCLASYTVAEPGEGITTCLENARTSVAGDPSLVRDTSDEGLMKRGCYIACLMQNVGMMNGTVINLQKIDEMIDQISSMGGNVDDLRETVHQCVESGAGDDLCAVAKNFAKCGLIKISLRLRQVDPILSV